MLLTRLPRKILDRPIETGFRKWLRFGALWDSPLRPEEKYTLSLLNILGEIPDRQEEYFRAIMDFYACGEKPREAPPAPERLLDWRADGPAVWADFRIYAGINLDRAKLHWWEFMALFQSLPDEARVKQRMAVRGIDLTKIKDPQTREEYARQKRLAALDPLPEDDWYERM